MRSDMVSLNPGKVAAQACHAANKFVKSCTYKKSLKEWEEQSDGQGFGTTIVLDAKYLSDIIDTIEEIKDGADFLDAGIVLDQTYPVRDGEVTHLIPVKTCGYVFGKKEALSPYLSKFELYP